MPLPTQKEMLTELIGTPSVSSPDARFDQSNRGVVDLVANWAESLGFRCVVEEVPGVSGKYNLIARLGEGEGGLVLSGHSDTVPYNEEQWTSSPFELVEREGRFYGLGTADMKGFFAAALHAVASRDVSSLTRPLTLLATADEESTMSGAKALAQTGKSLGSVAVIGEPTGLVPVRKHKGIAMVRLIIEGQGGHASAPALGVNAIEGAHRVVTALQAWAGALDERHRDSDFAVQGPTVNLGRIAGGDSPNRICARCEIDIDIRTLPGMDGQAVLDEVRQVAEASLQGGDWSFRMVPIGVYPGFEADSESAFQRGVETLCGCSATAVMFGTEAPYFTQLGMDTVVLGAGDIAVAHREDEYVDAVALQRATELYATLIDTHCTES